MIKKTTLLLSLFLAICNFNTNAQQPVEYFSNHDIIHEIYSEGDTTWVATDGGLLELDAFGNLIKKHTVLDGLALNIKGFLPRGGTPLVSNNYELYERKGTEWKLHKEPKKTKFLDLINCNNVFGYLFSRKGNLYLKKGEKWLKYKTKLHYKMRKEAVLFDNDGDLWVGSEGGVVHFINKQPNEYNFLPDQENIDALAKDSNGKIWGLNSYSAWWVCDKKDLTWKVYKGEHHKDLSTRKSAFVDSKNNLWFINEAQNALYKYDGNSWEKILVPVIDVSVTITNRKGIDKITTIYVNRKGQVWLGTETGNLYKYDKGTWTVINVSEEAPLIKDPNMYITFANKDTKGDFWIGESHRVSYRNFVTGETKIWERDDFKGTFRYANVIANSIVESSNGDIYLNPQADLFKLNKETNQWNNLLPKEAVYIMFKAPEKEGVILFTNTGKKIHLDNSGKLTTEQILPLKKADEEYSFRHGALDSKGNLWLNTEQKLYHIAPDNVLTSFDNTNSPLKTNDITPFIFDDKMGNVWIGLYNTETYENQLAKWNGHQWTIFDRKNSPIEGSSALNFSNKPRGLHSFFTDKKNKSTYLLSGKKILKYDGIKWKVEKNLSKYVSYARAKFFKDSKSRLWILNDYGKIYLCEEGECKEIIKDSAKRLENVLEDNLGRIWIFTEHGGVFRYSDPAN